MKKWKEELNKLLKEAMMNKEALRASVLKMLKTDLTNEEIKNERKDLTEEQTLKVIQRAAKQRKDSIEEYRKVEKMEQVEQEEAELNILQEFLPEQLSEDAVKKIVEETVKEANAEGMKDMGKVMGMVMGKVKGKADGKLVQDLVRAKLS